MPQYVDSRPMSGESGEVSASWTVDFAAFVRQCTTATHAECGREPRVLSSGRFLIMFMGKSWGSPSCPHAGDANLLVIKIEPLVDVSSVAGSASSISRGPARSVASR